MSVITCESSAEDINGWMVLRIPKDASLKLPSRGQVMVKGTVNGIAVHMPAEPDGNASHWLHVDEDLQKKTGIARGSKVKISIEATKDWPEPSVPADVQKGIVENPLVSTQWSSVTPMARWEWLRWINSTANADTRKKRIDVSVSKLSLGERRPCCFNRSMCCVPEVSKSGVLIGAL